MNNWEKVTLSELGKIITGKTPKTAISENYGDYIQFLTPSDDMNIKYCTYTNRMLSKVGLKEVSNNLLPANSICVSCIGSDLGKVIITTKETVTNQQINSIIVNENYNVDFVYYAMLILGKKMNFISKTSTAVPIINKSTFSNYTINIPVDKDEQKRIADVLSALDDKIEINNKINENLEAQAQAIFKQWFVDFEFPDEEGKPYKSNGGKFIDSELGEIPEGWRLGSIGDYCKVRSGFAFKSSWWLDDNFKEDKVKVIKIKCIDNSQINLNDCSFVSSDKCELAREFLVNEGDLVIAMTGATLGKFAIIPKLDEKLLVNQRVGKFFLGVKPIEKLPFLHLTLKQDRVYNEIVNKGQGSAQPNISSSDIENVEIVFPNEEILCDFNSKMNYLYQLLSNNKNENQKLSELRDSLLPRLMSGEVRV